MPRSEKTQAAQTIVSEASAALNLDLMEELAQPLAEYLLDDYTAEDWRDSPLVEALARVAALLEVDGRKVPDSIMDALRRAAEAGQPVGVAWSAIRARR